MLILLHILIYTLWTSDLVHARTSFVKKTYEREGIERAILAKVTAEVRRSSGVGEGLTGRAASCIYTGKKYTFLLSGKRTGTDP
jgi:hypothetical protein